MRPSAVPILTILTFLGFVASMHPLDRAVLAHRALAVSPAAVSSTSSADAAATPTTTSTTSTDTTTRSTSTTTSSKGDITTSESTTFFSEISTTQRSSTSELSSSTTSRITSTRSSSPVVPTLATPVAPTFISTGSDGASFTVTAIVSRPSGATPNDETSVSSRTGFFANKGAVAGTFLIAGLVGTAFFLCAFLWALRRYRRHRNDRAYFDDEYKEFNRERNGTTPEPTLPTAHDSAYVTPIPRTPTPNMIERLHGPDQPSPTMDYGRVQGQYVRESGEFDPYKAHDATFGHSDDQVNYAPYTQFVEEGHQQSGAYAYGSQLGAHAATSAQHQTGPSYLQQHNLNPLGQVAPNLRGSQAH